MGPRKQSRTSGFGVIPLLILSSCSGLCAQSLTRQAKFQTNAQLVLVPVTVTDRSGKTVEGLRAEDFSILDEHAPQRIVSFAKEDAPCSIGILLDISGSMRTTLASAKTVAGAFIQAANSEDEFMLLTVSTMPASVSGFTRDLATLENQINFANSGGMTALIDTVYLGLSHMRGGRQSRKALLILSDGIDNYSRYSETDVMREALEADVQIYTVIVDNGAANSGVPFRPGLIKKPIDQARERQGPALLEKLSEKTGGLSFHVSNNVQAQQAAAKAGRAIRDQYLIGYQSPNSGKSGKWRRVRVKSSVPKVNVHARSGYYSTGAL